MQSRTDPASPWGQRLYFDAAEFEVMMDELRQRVPGSTFTEGCGVDVDRVLLTGLGLEPDYVDLADGVMGRVIFAASGKAHVEVSRRLADEAESGRIAAKRLRSTLAHEAGHVTCHPLLFIGSLTNLSLFGGEMPPPAILCRDSTVGRMSYSGQWWEFQANQCMAALLLPKPLFMKYTASAVASRGASSFNYAIRAGTAEAVVRDLADIFNVSEQMVFYRLTALGHVPDASQFSMFLD